MSCLGDEFDRLCAAIPLLRHNLIVDGGGYIGTAAIAFAKKYPSATTMSLEPDRANYQLLAENTASWPNILIMNRALAPETDISTLYDRGTGAWGFTLIEKAADRIMSPIEGVVQCITVDEVIAKVGADGSIS